MNYHSQKGGRKQFHNRRSIRLKGYDYSQAGLYFITICCENKVHRFGKIENDEMVLNENGTIANNEWYQLLIRYPNFELDAFQIMPNHMHGIISLKNAVGSTISVTPNTENTMENIQPQYRAGASPALRFRILLGHINPWWQMDV